MKGREARAIADEIHDRYMMAAVTGQGFDDAYKWTRAALKRVTSKASNDGYARGRADTALEANDPAEAVRQRLLAKRRAARQ